MKVAVVTVLICTYNRASFLRETLSAIISSPRRPDYTAEIIVVDNNSTDETRAVVQQAAAAAPLPVRYAFEGRQGKSFALNLGLQMARGEVIALTDDDVWPQPAWLDRIVDAFRTHDITFAFGKVLPRWSQQPPPELLTDRAHEIWGPLAILDYGNEVAAYTQQNTDQRLPVGANLAFKRQMVVDIGGWRTDLGKVDNSLISGEDHEIFHRMRRYNVYSGLYDPSIAVRHYVPASRLTRSYFRRWFYWHGKTLARMPQEIFYDLDFKAVPHVLGVPRFLYRQFLQQVWQWARVMGSRDALTVLVEELRTIQHLGYFSQCWEWSLRRTPRPDDVPSIASVAPAAFTPEQPPAPILEAVSARDSKRRRVEM
jgi:glycosyltransferase involved in cell wall biosynthesis